VVAQSGQKVEVVMLKVDLTAIEEAKARFNGDLGLVKKELKRLQSVKCRLKKEKASADYQAKMEAVLDQEQVLKEVRSLLDPKEVKVPDFTQEDVDRLDYDQTIKAIKSIQYKKCLSLQDPSAHGQAELAKAEKVEKMLLEHKKTVKPVDDGLVRKSEVQSILTELQSNKKLTKKAIEELLSKLV
jgi:hypothetical protein